MESKFLQTQKFQPFVWFRHIHDIFSVWTHGENSLKHFVIEFNNFNPSIKFTYEFSEAGTNFLDLRSSVPSFSIKSSQTYQKVNSIQSNTKSQ